ncbi:hypothetical protein AB0I84_41000 [Streptomyces spectabilis]|uniref:hypothetical protein n=1 Tax=Streptomyces spectabilis TaxID=68270 RepID=UPI0034045799
MPPPERLMPAHQLYLSQLALYLRDSQLIDALWALYTHEHCDPATGQPDDAVAYSHRQTQRDADLLSAFGPVYYHADTLLEAAQQQLDQLPDGEPKQHFTGQLRQLHTSTQQLYAVRHRWIHRRSALPDGPGEGAHEALLAASYAEARPYLARWADQGHVVLDVHALAQQSGGRSASMTAGRENQLKAAPATPPPAPRAAPPSSRAR